MPRDEDYDYDDKADDAVLHLVKTRLRVNDDELQRLNKDGGFLLRIPLADVQSIELRSSFDPICLVILAGALGVAAIAYFVSEWVILNIILYIVAIVLAIIACFGVIARSFVIRTVDGETKILNDDTPDEGECFVISVRRLLRTLGNDRGPRISRQPRDPETGFRE